jgi:hypothetical protein
MPVGTTLTQQVTTAFCATDIKFALWPRIGRRGTAEKQTTLQEQRALTSRPIRTSLTQQVTIDFCAPDVKFARWPRIGSRGTAEKQTTLQEQRALT